MITGSDFYHVMTAMVPLYVAMFLAYGSVKWWKIFTPDQCSGINRFVALFAVPLLSFHFISTNDPYAMNFHFIAADTLQKIIILVALAFWSNLTRRGSLDWTITLFSLSTLPNTLVMGIPLLKGMYGDASGTLMVQIVVLQCIIWYTLMLFMFEYRGAKLLISEQFPDTAGSIVSIHVDSDIMSLDGRHPLETEAQIKEDGKLHVTVRRSNASRSDIFSRRSQGGLSSNTPRPSNLTNAEIYSLQSSRNPTPRGSSFNHTDFYSMMAAGRSSNVKKGNANGQQKGGGGEEGGKDLHMFVWSSSASPVSDVFGSHEYGGHHNHHNDHKDVRVAVSPSGKDEFSFGNRGGDMVMNNGHEGGGAGEKAAAAADGKAKIMPPTSVMTRLILIMVWRKLIRNPNTYSSLIGLIWSLVSFRWHVTMPAIIAKSISILSDAGLGMAMFSLGLFMALQPRIIACGKSTAAFAMGVRFFVGPAVMAAASIVVGLRGTLLHIAIVQAALPQGIVPFVFAKEYNVHPDILSTGVIFGMLIALPFTLVYYILLGL
ncbi:unnamed protein product [Linum tenue]|uniref:Auxin efflux carrier component n=1 Tax=Linum tenue TaxID=586396 RepID=A0AAV0ISM1_9ROSI|nr:unnamed protein product [Linum tenue]